MFYLKLQGIENGKSRELVFSQSWKTQENLDKFVENFLEKNPAFIVCVVDVAEKPWKVSKSAEQYQGPAPVQKPVKQRAKTAPKAKAGKVIKLDPLELLALGGVVDLTVALDTGKKMPAPTLAAGGSLKAYKPAKTKKAAKLQAGTMYGQAEMASISPAVQKKIDKIIAIAKKLKIKIEQKGSWLWFGKVENDLKARAAFAAEGISLHWACDKKCYCWHDEANRCGWGKETKTAAEITAKYGAVVVA